MFQMFHFILCTMLRKQICTLHRLVNANQQFDIVYILDRGTDTMVKQLFQKYINNVLWEYV